MAKKGFQSVEDYIAAQSERARPALERVRHAIRKAIPDAEEAISYQIPAFERNGTYVVYFAAWKEHFSLYPAPERLVAAFQGELSRYKASKGTLRFPLSEPVPVKLIERVARFLAREAAERAKARSTKPTKRR